MNYIVLDLEWNQEMFESHDLKFEIIEIGAVKLNENFQVVSKFSSKVCPSVHKRMNPYIQEITGITFKELKRAPKFTEVIKSFAKWCGEDVLFCTFGSQDLLELQHNICYYGISLKSLGFHWKYPLKYIDVQHVYSLFHRDHIDGTLKIASLEHALLDLNIDTEKNFHRALEDAEYTARLMMEMESVETGIHQKNLSLDHFRIPQRVSEEQEIFLSDRYEFLTCGYRTKEELMARKELSVVRCLECGKKCRKKIHWFADNSKHVCVGICKTHGYLLGTMNFRVNQFDDKHKHYAVRKVRRITDEEFAKVAERVKFLRERRRQKRQRQKNN